MIIEGVIFTVLCLCMVYIGYEWGHSNGYSKGRDDGKRLAGYAEVSYAITLATKPTLDPPTKIMPDKPGLWRLRYDREWNPRYCGSGNFYTPAPRPRGWQDWQVVDIEVIDHKGQLFCADDGQRVEAREGRWLGPCTVKGEVKA